jgi:very-short-patch-repair endonuclease
MQSHGIRILRFPGKQVDLEAYSVCETIDAFLRDASPHDSSL